ncbi:MAG TPA: HlyD family efflux transporter periplasmic adaptor subunit [Longimicrobium sp.]|nr:HlyD family efflux transporter periplasmic adaptor subunit [Longimicrobium sp.]
MPNRIQLHLEPPTPVEPAAPHQLPEMRSGRGGTGPYIRRAVSIVLGLLALFLGTALVVAFAVRVDDVVGAQGVLEPGRVWPVRTLEAGMIREVLVQTGDTVARGQTVARLDPLFLRAALAELEAERRAGGIELRKVASETPHQRRQQAQLLAQADSRLVTARATLRQRMAENGYGIDVDSLLGAYRVGSHVALDLAVAEVRAAEAARRLVDEQTDALGLSRFARETGQVNLEQLDAQIGILRERLARLDITAPTSGLVLTEQIEQLPGSSVKEGDLLLEMAEPEQWRIILFVREGEVHKVRLGDSVKAEIQAFPMDERDLLRGSVVHVATEPVARTGDNVTRAAAGSYRVIVAMDPRQLAELGAAKFRRGYTVEGRIIARSGRIIDLFWDHVQKRLDLSWPW